MTPHAFYSCYKSLYNSNPSIIQYVSFSLHYLNINIDGLSAQPLQSKQFDEFEKLFTDPKDKYVIQFIKLLVKHKELTTIATLNNQTELHKLRILIFDKWNKIQNNANG